MAEALARGVGVGQRWHVRRDDTRHWPTACSCPRAATGRASSKSCATKPISTTPKSALRETYGTTNISYEMVAVNASYDRAARTLLTRAGDVVFFDPRLSHAGQPLDPFERVLFRAGQKLRVPAPAYHAKEAWRRLLGKRPKLSLFFTYGAPGRDTDGYCAFEAQARRRAGRPGAPALSPELLGSLAARRVACNPWLAPA